MTSRPSIDLTDLKVEVSSFGGYAPRSPEETLPGFAEVNVLTDGQNLALEYPVGSTAKTTLVTRLGYTKRNPTPFSLDKVQGVKVWKLAAENNYRIVAVAEGKLFEATFFNVGDTLNFVYKPGAVFHPNNPIVMKQLNQKLYIADGVHRMRSWSGTAFVEIVATADDPYPSIIIVHQARLWINSTRAGQRAQGWWSEYDDGDGWVVNPAGGHDAGTQTFKGFPDDKNEVTAFFTFAGGLLVFQPKKAFIFITTGSPYNVGGDQTWEIRELNISVGATNQAVVADLGEKVMYLTSRGVNELTGIQALNNLSVATYDTLNAKPVSFDVEPTLFSLLWDGATAVFHKFYYILNLRSRSSRKNDTALVYDVRRGVWYTPWTNYNFNCFDTAMINGQEYCFAGSSIDGTIYTLFTGVDDAGTPIEAWGVTAAWNYTMPRNTKTFRKGYVSPVTTSRGIYLSYSVDYAPWIEFDHEFVGQGADATPLGQFVLGKDRLGYGFTRNVRRPFSIGRRGIHCRIKFSNQNTKNTGGIKPYGVEFLGLRAYMEDEDQREYR